MTMEFFATCSRGFESILGDELRAAGCTPKAAASLYKELHTEA